MKWFWIIFHSTLVGNRCSTSRWHSDHMMAMVITWQTQKFSPPTVPVVLVLGLLVRPDVVHSPVGDDTEVDVVAWAQVVQDPCLDGRTHQLLGLVQLRSGHSMRTDQNRGTGSWTQRLVGVLSSQIILPPGQVWSRPPWSPSQPDYQTLQDRQIKIQHSKRFYCEKSIKPVSK